MAEASSFAAFQYEASWSHLSKRSTDLTHVSTPWPAHQETLSRLSVGKELVCLSCTSEIEGRLGSAGENHFIRRGYEKKKLLKDSLAECRAGGELCCLDLGAGACCESLCWSLFGADFSVWCSLLKLGFWRRWQAGAQGRDFAVMQNFWCCFDSEQLKTSMFFTQQYSQIRSDFFFFFNSLIKCKDFFKELIKCLCSWSICRFSFTSTKKNETSRIM